MGNEYGPYASIGGRVSNIQCFMRCRYRDRVWGKCEGRYSLLIKLENVPGRMQLVGAVSGGSVYVDYAHTPNALKHVLTALRSHTRGRLIAVIGCGGDRDPGKVFNGRNF